MENNNRESMLFLFESANSILRTLPSKERYDMDDLEVVFIDTINGKLKANRTFGFLDTLEAINNGGKPVGLLLLNWEDPDNMQVKEFPGLTTEESSVLTHAFAEAQDQAKEEYEP
jgi:hypothetical protein